MGPLPMAKGMGSIRSRQSSGPFKMCQWVASTKETKVEAAETFPICEPGGSTIFGGIGPFCDLPGGPRLP